MPTYNDIGQAFGRFCEKSWELRDKAFSIGMTVFGAMSRRGQLSPDVFKPHPAHLDDLDLAVGYTVPGAMRYNIESRLWELGACLVVRRGNDIVPCEHLRLMFTIRQTPGDYTVALPGSEASVTFSPADPEGMRTAIDGFADCVLQDIITYYDSRCDKWLEDGQERVIGFHARPFTAPSTIPRSA